MIHDMGSTLKKWVGLGGTLNHQLNSGIVHEINHPAIGVPLMETPTWPRVDFFQLDNQPAMAQRAESVQTSVMGAYHRAFSTYGESQNARWVCLKNGEYPQRGQPNNKPTIWGWFIEPIYGDFGECLLLCLPWESGEPLDVGSHNFSQVRPP